MTVIAVKDGIMAADSALWLGNIVVEHIHKIRRLHDGRLFAAGGDRAAADACHKWLDGLAEKPDAETEEASFGGMILAHDGVWRVDYKFRIYPAASTAVSGSNTEFMMGALYAGASAEEAVRLAIQYGDSAAGDVQVEHLQPAIIRHMTA